MLMFFNFVILSSYDGALSYLIFLDQSHFASQGIVQNICCLQFAGVVDSTDDPDEEGALGSWRTHRGPNSL